jgi:hypothetical protein
MSRARRTPEARSADELPEIPQPHKIGLTFIRTPDITVQKYIFQEDTSL